jgi:putative ABC transport system ATP-binding protein
MPYRCSIRGAVERRAFAPLRPSDGRGRRIAGRREERRDMPAGDTAGPEPVIRTERLGRRAGGRTILSGVSVAARRGEILAVVGPSGSGKTTLLRLLNRLDEPTEGTVFLDGTDYREMPPGELRRRVGMVLQTPHLFDGTVADNLRFGPAQRGEAVPEESVSRLLERVGLGGYEGRDADRLSGGEAQRVSLARTLMNSPDVLLLDEPTSALDEAAVGEVEALIRGLVVERGLGCLLVTHDREQAARVASAVVVLDRGRVARFGPVEEVLRA